MTTYDDEIDIREYVLIILSNWWKILIITAIFAIIGFSISYFSPEKFEASATIIINRNQLVLSLAKQFPTISISKDTRSFSEAIMSLAKSDAVAQNTIENLGTKIPLGLRTPYKIKGSAITVTSEGDAILISATTSERDLSALIANAWANETKDLINLTYSGVQPLVEIQSQLTNAEKDYRSAQSALEDFYAKSQISSLELQIQETENILSNAIEDQNWIIEYNLDRKHALRHFLAQTNYLKNQIDSGATSTPAQVGDSLALLLARNQVLDYKNSINVVEDGKPLYLPSQPVITIQMTDLTPFQDTQSSLSSDLNNLSKALQNEIIELDQLIDSNLSSLEIEPTAEEIQALTSKLQGLNVQFEKENAEQKELTNKRDLAWTTYSTLQAKETEIRTAMEASSIVSLASEAIAPQEPKPRNIKLYTAASLFAGFAFSCFLFFAIQWWKSEDNQSQEDD